MHFLGEDMWTYKCKAGLYKSDNLALLLIAIVSHRFSHFIKGEGFID
jgi:hypothetical protein